MNNNASIWCWYFFQLAGSWWRICVHSSQFEFIHIRVVYVDNSYIRGATWKRLKCKWIWSFLTCPVDKYCDLQHLILRCFGAHIFIIRSHLWNTPWNVSFPRALRHVEDGSSLQCLFAVKASSCFQLETGTTRRSGRIRTDQQSSLQMRRAGRKLYRRAAVFFPIVRPGCRSCSEQRPSSADQWKGCRADWSAITSTVKMGICFLLRCHFISSLFPMLSFHFQPEQRFELSCGKIYVRLWVRVQNVTHPVYSLKRETTLLDQQAWHAGQLTSNPTNPPPPKFHAAWPMQHRSPASVGSPRSQLTQQYCVMLSCESLNASATPSRSGNRCQTKWAARPWVLYPVCVSILFFRNILNPELLFSLGELKTNKNKRKKTEKWPSVAPKHFVDVVRKEAEDHQLHHRGPTLISMDVFMGSAAAVDALHFIYQ